MTQEDQDAIVGRTHRELRDVREKLEKLRAKARDLGDSFDTVTYHLRNHLEFLRLDGESADVRFVEKGDSRYGSLSKTIHTPKRETLEFAAVVAIRDEIRLHILEEKRLSQSLEKMGFSDSLKPSEWGEV
jgi:hypothetical protein